MKILLFGGNGMAGHMVTNYLETQTPYEVFCTVREEPKTPKQIQLNVMDKEKVSTILELLSPDIVINAVGILNEYADKKPFEAIYVNSFFPHYLKELSKVNDYRLIHISTDCVFSGNKGMYLESDSPDGTSNYAKTKCLGEIIDNTNITIRTSIIGPELKQNGIGLFHWFMNQQEPIKGYQNVYWNGITTLELAKTILYIIQNPINGLIHLTAPDKISKYNLLNLIKETYSKEITIHPCEKIRSDKTLKNTRNDFHFRTLPYPKMLQELSIWMNTQKKYFYYLPDKILSY